MGTASGRAARAKSGAATKGRAAAGEVNASAIVHELSLVASYIAHVKDEIGALKPNEITRERLPSVNDELGNVLKATASATHTILAAAEDILDADDPSFEAYRQRVKDRVLKIFEACAFQDINGQRIAKVAEALGQLEQRLGRFSRALKVVDSAEPPEPEEALRQARREVLLLHGPAAEGEGTAQADIDRLFD